MFLRLIAIIGILISTWGMTSMDDDGLCLNGHDSIGDSTSDPHELADPTSNSHRDPCHQGICHFGHCAHIRMATAFIIMEKQVSYSFEENTPYNFQISSDTEKRQDRPPISQV